MNTHLSDQVEGTRQFSANNKKWQIEQVEGIENNSRPPTRCNLSSWRGTHVEGKEGSSWPTTEYLELTLRKKGNSVQSTRHNSLVSVWARVLRLRETWVKGLRNIAIYLMVVKDDIGPVTIDCKASILRNSIIKLGHDMACYRAKLNILGLVDFKSTLLWPQPQSSPTALPASIISFLN